MSEHGSTRRVALTVVILALLLTMSVGAVQASLWAIRGPVDDSIVIAPAWRMALVWAAAWVGPALVMVCARYPRSSPLFSRRRALPWAPWLTVAVVIWLAFIVWLGMIGAGVSGLTIAFTVILCCASILTPAAMIGLAFERKIWIWLLPTGVMLTAASLYAAYFPSFFGA